MFLVDCLIVVSTWYLRNDLMRDGKWRESSFVDGTRRLIAMRQICWRLGTCMGDNQNVTEPFLVLERENERQIQHLRTFPF